MKHLLFFLLPLCTLSSSETFAQTLEMVADINPSGSSTPQLGRSLNGKMYFQADDGVHGVELWYTDGTAAGTSLLKDINPDASSGALLLTVFHDQFFFPADDGINGKKIWRSDGTADGTQLFYDFNSSGDDLPPFVTFPTIFNDAFYLIAQSSAFFGKEVLWKCDENGPVFPIYFADPVSNFFRPTVLNDKLYFVVLDNSDNSKHLWVTDGEQFGTTEMVAQIGADGSNPTVRNRGAAIGKLFFSADDGVHGIEMWVSDGTTAGTYMLKDIHPAGNSNPAQVYEINGIAIFSADDGEHGSEWWMTDGTEAGTQLLKDIHPAGSANPSYLGIVGNRLFFAATDTSSGREIWTTDGTPAGTKIFKDIHPTGDAAPGPLYPYGNRYLFTADDGIYGKELWITNGDPDSTMLFYDLHPTGSSTPFFVGRHQNDIYWSAEDAAHGRELWRMADITGLEPGPASPLPMALFPNPTSQWLWIQVENPALVEVYNAFGTKIRSFQHQPGQPVSVAELPAGTYHLYCPEINARGTFLKM